MATSIGAAHAQVVTGTPGSDCEPGLSDIEIPDEIGPDLIDSFIAPLTDDQTRRLLLATLAERAASTVPAEVEGARSLTFSGLLEDIRAGSSKVSENMAALFEALPRTGEIIDHAFTLLEGAGGEPS